MSIFQRTFWTHLCLSITKSHKIACQSKSDHPANTIHRHTLCSALRSATPYPKLYIATTVQRNRLVNLPVFNCFSLQKPVHTPPVCGLSGGSLQCNRVNDWMAEWTCRHRSCSHAFSLKTGGSEITCHSCDLDVNSMTFIYKLVLYPWRCTYTERYFLCQCFR